MKFKDLTIEERIDWPFDPGSKIIVVSGTHGHPRKLNGNWILPRVGAVHYDPVWNPYLGMGRL